MNVDREKRADHVLEYFQEHQRVVEKSLVELSERAHRVGIELGQALRKGRKVLVFGNGGSAAEASHFAGELMGRFQKAPRIPLPAVALGSDPAIVTSIGNDFGYGALFERQLEALVKPGDVALALTTSGRSENVVRGIAVAKRKKAITVALTGFQGFLGVKPNYVLKVPSSSTSHIQEVHLALLHLWCLYVEDAFRSRSR